MKNARGSADVRRGGDPGPELRTVGAFVGSDNGARQARRRWVARFS
jgi:hypothetical protein